jgi:hypothetical protein
MDPKKIEKIRKTIAKVRKPSGRIRYPQEIKLSVQELIRAGANPTELAELTGIGLSTIFGWARNIDEKEFSSMKVGPIEEIPEIDQMKIIFPGGVAVECSSLRILKSILEIAGDI